MTLNLRELNEDEVYKQMFKEFNKTKENLYEDIDILRKWTETQPHFPEKPSDKVLRFVILFNKFSIEKAKQKLDMYYTMRGLIPELCTSDPLCPEMVLHSKVNYCVPLPRPTPDSKRVIYSQFNPNFGPEFFVHSQYVEQVLNLFELLILEDPCYCFHFIMDCVGVTIGHLPKFNPVIIKKFSVVLEKVYSSRVGSAYIVNFPPIMETVINNVFKPMLNPKIRDRLTIHSNTDILLEVYGKSMMPKDIGGEERSLEELNECLLKDYDRVKDRFEVLRNLRVDESLRPEKLVNDDVLGYYGNFKKVNVD